MIVNELQSNIIYDKIYIWLSAHTPGSRCSKSTLKCYQENVWNPILQAIKELDSNAILSDEDKEFFNMVLYNGPIFRIQNYNPRYKGYIYKMEYYQSWAKSLEGVNNVSNLDGNVLLIVGNAVNGINIFGLLSYLFKYKKITHINAFRNPEDLCMYEKEEEIAFPVQLNYIEKIVTVDRNKIFDWENNCITISKEKWARNSLY